MAGLPAFGSYGHHRFESGTEDPCSLEVPYQRVGQESSDCRAWTSSVLSLGTIEAGTDVYVLAVESCVPAFDFSCCSSSASECQRPEFLRMGQVDRRGAHA